MTDGIGRTLHAVSSAGYGNYPHGLDEGYAELAAAIIKQAVVDYEAVLGALFQRPTGMKRIELETEKAGLENFFHSAWYETLTDIDGNKLIEATRRLAVERAKKAIRKQHEKKLKGMRP